MASWVTPSSTIVHACDAILRPCVLGSLPFGKSPEFFDPSAPLADAFSHMTQNDYSLAAVPTDPSYDILSTECIAVWS
jgi:hypothetical protein